MIPWTCSDYTLLEPDLKYDENGDAIDNPIIFEEAEGNDLAEEVIDPTNPVIIF